MCTYLWTLLSSHWCSLASHFWLMSLESACLLFDPHTNRSRSHCGTVPCDTAHSPGIQERRCALLDWLRVLAGSGYGLSYNRCPVPLWKGNAEQQCRCDIRIHKTKSSISVFVIRFAGSNTKTKQSYIPPREMAPGVCFVDRSRRHIKVYHLSWKLNSLYLYLVGNKT